MSSAVPAASSSVISQPQLVLSCVMPGQVFVSSLAEVSFTPSYALYIDADGEVTFTLVNCWVNGIGQWAPSLRILQAGSNILALNDHEPMLFLDNATFHLDTAVVNVQGMRPGVAWCVISLNEEEVLRWPLRLLPASQEGAR